MQAFDDFEGGLPAGGVFRGRAGAGGEVGQGLVAAEAADGGDGGGETVGVDLLPAEDAALFRFEAEPGDSLEIREGGAENIRMAEAAIGALCRVDRVEAGQQDRFAGIAGAAARTVEAARGLKCAVLRTGVERHVIGEAVDAVHHGDEFPGIDIGRGEHDLVEGLGHGALVIGHFLQGADEEFIAHGMGDDIDAVGARLLGEDVEEVFEIIHCLLRDLFAVGLVAEDAAR